MLNIAIVSGGDSGEYEISVRSGRQVAEHLDRNRYNPYLIEIRRNEWVCDTGKERIPVDRNDFTILCDGRKIGFRVVFNAIHGTPGEDGKLQGYFDMLGIPCTSSDVATSALTFHKSFCKNVVGSYGIDIARSVHLFRREADPDARILKELSLPLFIKPNNGGSSVGMSKVNRAEDLAEALDRAFREDTEVLAEEFIKGRELTCGVIRTEGDVVAFPVTEIISKKEFFDYEAKYQEGLASEVVPAEVSPEVSARCREISAFLYGKLNCRGVVRFDYIYTEERFYFLEVNTVPGLTAQSIVPKMVRAHGWTESELYTRMIEECLKKI